MDGKKSQAELNEGKMEEWKEKKENEREEGIERRRMKEGWKVGKEGGREQKRQE